jgi:hypothetical protein
MSHIVNKVNWASKDAVKRFGAELNMEYEQQIVPLDLQFRLSELIILLIKILAEKGNQSWHAVFKKHDLMDMSVAIKVKFLPDPLQPFYNFN